MGDVYLYNATNKNLDTTSSMSDLTLRTSVIVPPGSQAHIQVDDSARKSLVTYFESYGAIAHATVQSPATFVGVSHAPQPVAIAGKTVPVVEVPVVKPANVQTAPKR